MSFLKYNNILINKLNILSKNKNEEDKIDIRLIIKKKKKL